MTESYVDKTKGVEEEKGGCAGDWTEGPVDDGPDHAVQKMVGKKMPAGLQIMDDKNPEDINAYKQFGDAWVNIDIRPVAVVFNHKATGGMVEQKVSKLMIPGREEKPSHAKLFYGENWVDLMNEDAAAYYDWWLEQMK